MIRAINWINQNRLPIYITLLFIVTGAAITYLLPKETKFKYEFQKGKPWLHNDLIATYDFPIYKLPEELEREQDSIKNAFEPYFVFEKTVGQDMLGAFQQRFHSTLRSVQDSIPAFKAKDAYPHNEKEISKAQKHLLQELQFVYIKGVLPLLEMEDDLPEHYQLVVMQDNFAEELDNSEVFSQLTAYNYLRKNFENFVVNSLKSDSSYLDFFGKLNISNFIVPNLNYDEATTEKIQKSQLEKLSVTKGMVQKGQRIVSRGEMVTVDKFRILFSLKKEFQMGIGSYDFYWLSLGQAMLVAIVLYILYQFLSSYRHYVLLRLGNVVFIMMLLLASLLVTTVVLRFSASVVYLIPYVAIPILLKNFFDTRVAFISHIINIVLLGLLVPNSFEFMFIQFAAGFIGMFYLTNFYRRGSLTATAGVVAGVYALTYTAYSIIQEGSILTIDYSVYLWFVGNSVLLLVAYPAIYIFEKIFGFVSELTLIELGDVNHPLLRELAEKAPGTFQHSLQVANLGESAAFKIEEANPLLIRTGALYHDIGKIAMPHYFVENQISGINPHDDLPFDRSAEIIIGHVNKGIEIAKKHKLPNMVIDFIRTHHGTSKAQYFYRMYQNQFPNKEVDPDKFTYPGPKPYSKETAILMMADAVEAASRSLKEISEQSISELIEKIISFQMKEEQFFESDITFKDITTIKEVFKQKLMNIYHARISYPEEKKSKEN